VKDAMNSFFDVVNQDDLTSYDVGIPSVTFSQSESHTRESKTKSNFSSTPDLTLFIEPTILTYPVDPETSLPLNELVERLYVESHLVTITTEVVTAKLLALEEERRLQEKARLKALEETLLNNNELEEKNEHIEQLYSEKPRQAKELIVQYRRPVETLISVRLKSGELLKTTREVLERLRQKKTNSERAESTQSDNVFIMNQLPFGIPFTDRLGNAIRLISSLPNPSNEVSKTPNQKKPINDLLLRSNGRIHKKLKVRAALDKSTVAWSSTVRLKPKTSLLQQLDYVANAGIKSNSSITTTAFPTDQDIITSTVNQTIHSEVRKPQKAQGKTLVPLIMKWKSSSNHTKMLPLSTALQRIANDTLESDSVNGIKTNGLHTNGVS